MFKSLLISIQIIALLVLKLIFGADVNLNQKIPSQVNAGESFTIEVTINKGERDGFAKWQQKLPEGFIVEPKETMGATFSFKNQEVKLIWMSIPSQEEFTISYLVSTNPTLSGKFDIGGKFSFIEEDERRDIEVNMQTITISEQGQAVADVPSQEPSIQKDSQVEKMEEIEANDAEEVMAEKAESNEEIQENVVEKNEAIANKNLVTNDPEIQIERIITHLNDGLYSVNLSIKKGKHNAFGKVEEYLPEDFEAMSNENMEGQFTFNNKVMKILWMSLPEDSTINVNYLMQSQSDLLENPVIHGMFSYLNNDNSVQIEMQATAFVNYYNPEADDLAMESNSEDSPSIELSKPILEKTAEQPETEKITPIEAEEAIAPKSTKELTASITTIPEPESGINFKVQIAAGKKEVKPTYFKTVHGITDEISSEYHETWFKYTLGNFDAYKAARDKRNAIWAEDNKIKDAFVCAYNSGNRITVQEALMISKQKWVQ